MPGWMTPTDHVTKYAELPGNARLYVEKLAELIGTKLAIVSVGPGREQTIRL
jgi:adenylosuccinate synthase